jgi:hypothetical protein
MALWGMSIFCMNCGNDHIELFEKTVGKIEGSIR